MLVLRTAQLVLLLLAGFLFAPVAARAESRLALVIGNAAYQHVTPLANSINDATLFASTLKAQGFDVSLHSDVDLKKLKRAIGDFFGKVERAGRDAVVVIYYAGHGVQVGGANYLIPVDAEIDKENDVAIEAVRADDIMQLVGGAGSALNIIILDACRNNPFRGFRSASRGLAQIDAPSGTLVAFSTAPGKVAQDGPKGGNSPYTAALSASIAEKGVKIEDVFKRVRQKVNADTGGSQVPWESSSLVGDFYPAGSVGTPTAKPTEAPTVTTHFVEAERLWETLKSSTDTASLEAFIARYGDTFFGDQAKARLAALKKTQVAMSQPNTLFPGAETFPALGLTLLPPMANPPGSKDGLYVVAVEVGSNAQEKGIVPGDVIVEIRGTMAVTTATVETALKAVVAEGRNAVLLRVRNLGGDRFVAVQLAKSATPTVALNQPPPLQPAPALQPPSEKVPGVGVPFKDCEQCPQMVVVPAGSFTMGSNDNDDEKPPHKVMIANPIAVGKFAVTFDEWDACVSDGGCKTKPSDNGFGHGKRPVINVSWDDIHAEYLPWIIKKTGKPYRLLSEAEWEYAARAGTTTKYFWGDDIGTGHANCVLCGGEWVGQITALVGTFKANAFGLYDMHGNVWQWVEDAYNPDYKYTPTDGSAAQSRDTSFRSARGGAWSDTRQFLRSASRLRLIPTFRYNGLGFRLARAL